MAYTAEQREAKKKEKEAQAAIVQVTEQREKIEIVPIPAPSADKIIRSRKLKKEIPLNTLIEVTNGFHGKLVYVSKKNDGMTVIWEEFGDTEYLELQELIAIRNSMKKFFINNWFIIEDLDILDFLEVTKYYENALNAEKFDEIFSKSPTEIENLVSLMSKGQQASLIYKLTSMIDSGELDSRKTINAFEKSLHTDLIEG